MLYYFKLIDLEDSTYDVSVNPRNDNYSEETVNGVDATVEETNDIGTVDLSQN